jgi:antitoxin component YwqK of YwqJK toxin-antitoxin module
LAAATLAAATVAACTSSQPRPPSSPLSPAAAIACGPGLGASSRSTVRGIEAWCEDEHGVRSGPFERRFPRGQLAERGRYAGGQLDGDYASFYANGAPHERGGYVRGQRDGAWHGWHENGKPWREISYAGGQPSGRWLEFDDAGATMFDGTYRDGRLEGAWRTWFRNGKPRASGSSVAGKMEGTLTEYFASGIHIEVPYRNNRAHGVLVEYDKAGKVLERVEYVDGVRQTDAQGNDAR